jgi:hypothetical protein
MTIAKSRVGEPGRAYQVGYKRPPAQTRFKPGVSGNPSGRPKGTANLKTLFNRILKEEVSLREGSQVRKVSKAEALMRGLVLGALKGDSRSLGALFRLAEQTGQFAEDEGKGPLIIHRVIYEAPPRDDAIPSLPGNRQVSRD